MTNLQLITYSMGKAESNPSKIRNKTRMSTLADFIQHILEVLVTAIREGKEIKETMIFYNQGHLTKQARSST